MVAVLRVLFTLLPKVMADFYSVIKVGKKCQI